MVEDFLLVANVVVAVLLVVLTGTYMRWYFWYKSPEGKIVVAGLSAALLVAIGGLCERFGNLFWHDVFKTLGYAAASVVLVLATWHLIQVQNGHAKRVEKRQFH